MNETNRNRLPNLKRVDKKKVSEELKKVEAVLSKMPMNDFTQTNDLIYAAATVVTENLGVKIATKENKNDPWWKKRLEGQVQQVRRDLSRLLQLKEGKLSKTSHREDLQKKYRLREKGVKCVFEESKQRIVAKAAKVRRY